jgi:AcrR family transcriptional regulator
VSRYSDVVHNASTKSGRPRSEQARRAVLHAVDDMLVEMGYAAMTMKGIAERAGVGRQTVYRWWSTKAEILLEACIEDLHNEVTGDDLFSYLQSLSEFLTRSPAGLAYLALLGEAQHDPAVRELLQRADLLHESFKRIQSDRLAAAQALGPVLFEILCGTPLPHSALARHVRLIERSWSEEPAQTPAESPDAGPGAAADRA